MTLSVRALRAFALVALAATAISLSTAVPAHASPPVIIGWASNFDVRDTTDKECHGFEIELEDITDTNIAYVYRNYHYGVGTREPVAAFPSGHSGVRVKYAATYNGTSWSATTPIGGIEHFGITLNAPAGAQRYSWLCEDSSNPGTLIEYGGSTEGNYYPMPPPPTPRAVVVPTPQGEVVRQEMENGEPPEPGQQRPDAVWVMRYAASSAQDVTLDQLMSNDPLVQQAIQNSMLDGQFELVDGGGSLLDDDPVSATDEASILVIDTYEYTGPYDDSHTPACDGQGGANDCTNFIGTTRLARQMFSADLGTATTARAALDVAVYTGLSSATTGGTVTSGTVPSADPEVGIDCGTSCFTVVDAGTAVTLTATPNPGFHLRAWGGACSGTAATCTVTVNGTTPVTATFYPDDPTVYVADASVIEGAAGTTKYAKFTVALTSARTVGTTVSYATSDGTATAGVDYTAKTGSVQIAAGATSATVSVVVRGDDAVEGDEAFSLDVTGVNTAAVAIGNPAAAGTIADDDTTAPPVLSLGTASIYEGNAGTQTAVFTVTLSKASATSTPVTFHTANGTATAGSDYTAKSSTINIAAGARMASIAVVVKGDAVAEGDETFRLIIDGTGASGVATDHDKVVATIVDDDTLGYTGVGIGDGEIVEGDTGARTVTLKVTLSAARAVDTVVKYRTIAGSATGGTDYTTKTASMKILAGKTTGAITVTVNGDTGLETDETLVVRLDDAGGVVIHHGIGGITLVGDDA